MNILIVFLKYLFQSGYFLLVLYGLNNFANAPVVFETVVHFFFWGHIPVLEDGISQSPFSFLFHFLLVELRILSSRFHSYHWLIFVIEHTTHINKKYPKYENAFMFLCWFLIFIVSLSILTVISSSSSVLWTG
jgi:hypothetical protein